MKQCKLDIVRVDIGSCQVDVDVYCEDEITYIISHQDKPQKINFEEIEFIKEKLTPLVSKLKKDINKLVEETIK